MNAISHRQPKQIRSCLRECEPQHSHRLQIIDDIFEGKALRQHGTRFVGRKGLVGQRDDRPPLLRRIDSRNLMGLMLRLLQAS